MGGVPKLASDMYRRRVVVLASLPRGPLTIISLIDVAMLRRLEQT
jgi:hypothetical protein